MSRSSSTFLPIHAAAVASLLAFAASSALSQVKAAFGGAHHAGGATPMQRSMASRQAPSRPMQQQFPSSGAGAVVGGGGFVGGSTGANTGVVIGGSGLVINGSYNTDNVNLAFHLGGIPLGTGCANWCPTGTNLCFPNRCYPYIWPYGYYGSYGYYDYYDGYYDNSNQRYNVIDGALVVGIPMSVSPATPAPAPEPPLPPPTDAELGASLLKGGDTEGAIDKFRLHLRDHGDDADAMRGLAVALLVKGEPDQGVAMMAMAYRADPTLVDHDLADDTMFRSDADLRKALQRAVAFANKIKSSSSWLTVAVLMQAEDRDDQAVRMIDRAAGLGLDAALAKRFKTALGG